MKRQQLPVALLALVLSAPLATFPGHAQSSCGKTEPAEEGETLEKLAARCDTTAEALLAANPDIEGQAITEGLQFTMPAEASESDWLDRARGALQDAGRTIDEAATSAGRSASDYLAEQPDLNRDLLEFGERLGLSGVSTTAEEDPELNVTPSRGAVGSEVTLTATGLPRNTEVVVRATVPTSDLQEISRVETDASGRLQTTVPVPDQAQQGEELQFVIETADQRVRVASEPFAIEP